MKKILVLGAGLSTTSLVAYLLDHADSENWKITLGDLNLDLAQKKVNGHPMGEAIVFDICNLTNYVNVIQKTDLVISMLPARFHILVAEACLEHNKPMVTASYEAPEIKNMEAEVQARGLIFLNELGVDPGIDHMSSMRIIDDIKSKGGKLISFK